MDLKGFSQAHLKIILRDPVFGDVLDHQLEDIATQASAPILTAVSFAITYDR